MHNWPRQLVVQWCVLCSFVRCGTSKQIEEKEKKNSRGNFPGVNLIAGNLPGVINWWQSSEGKFVWGQFTGEGGDFPGSNSPFILNISDCCSHWWFLYGKYLLLFFRFRASSKRYISLFFYKTISTFSLKSNKIRANQISEFIISTCRNLK